MQRLALSPAGRGVCTGGDIALRPHLTPAGTRLPRGIDWSVTPGDTAGQRQRWDVSKATSVYRHSPCPRGSARGWEGGRGGQPFPSDALAGALSLQLVADRDPKAEVTAVAQGPWQGAGRGPSRAHALWS